MSDKDEKTSVSVDAAGNELEYVTSDGKHLNIKDADEALEFAIHNKEEHIEIDEATSRRILRKIDLCLLPVMCLLYCFQFMDKISNSYASILGLRKELHMVGQQYSWTGTSFYIGYLAFVFPASYLLQKFPVAKTVSVFIVLWGLILALHSVPQYAGFIALRTILGMLESSVTPAFTIITAQWYTKDEHFLRVSYWFACNGLGTIVGAAIAHGLAEHQHSYSIEAWKLVFIVTGVLTIALGFFIFFHVPDNPTGAWFLKPTEKRLVVERIRVNQQGFGNRKFKKEQLIETLTDYKTWLLFFYSIAMQVPNGATTNFGSILLSDSMGYDPLYSLLMSMPGGAVEVVGCILFAYGTKFIRSRFFWGSIALAINIIAQCLLAFPKSPHVQLAGYNLLSLAAVGFICIISVVASNVAGHTKKITTNAIFLIGYCVGNLIGPQTFRASDAPKYHKAKVAMVICGVIAFVLFNVIWVVYIWENKQKEKLNLDDYEDFENSEFADLTDKENPRFRYET